MACKVCGSSSSSRKAPDLCPYHYSLEQKKLKYKEERKLLAELKAKKKGKAAEKQSAPPEETHICYNCESTIYGKPHWGIIPRGGRHPFCDASCFIEFRSGHHQ